MSVSHILHECYSELTYGVCDSKEVMTGARMVHMSAKLVDNHDEG